MSDEYRDSYQERLQDAIQVDSYGIKTRINPVVSVSPRDWKEVWERVHKSLMEIVTESFGFVSALLTTGSSFVKGVGRLPEALSKRIEGAQNRAILEEEKAQELLDSGHHPAQLTEGDAMARLRSLLNDLQAKGAAQSIETLPDGRILIAVVRPEHLQLAAKAVESVPQTEPSVAQHATPTIQYATPTIQYVTPTTQSITEGGGAAPRQRLVIKTKKPS